MSEHSTNLQGRGSFASAVLETFDHAAEELAERWLEAVRTRSPEGVAGRAEPPAGAAASAAGQLPVPELVRALAVAITGAAQGSDDDRGARVDRELTRLVRLRRAQGHSLNAVLIELDLLQDVIFDHLLAQASARVEDVPAEAVLAMVRRFHQTTRSMADTTRRLFRQEVAARRRSRAVLLVAFARAVTHELRNRLNAVRLSLSVARVSREEARPEALAALDESLRQLEDAVADVSSVALAQARELPLESRLQPLGELLEQLRGDFDELAQARKVTVRLAEPLPDVAVDAQKLQLVLLNLVANAIKHADARKEERWVEIRVAPGAARGEWRVDVEDNGLGLPVLQRSLEQSVGEAPPVVEPLSVQPEIGIVLAREAVTQLSGRLWIDANQPGGGSRVSFSMRVPR